MGCSFPSSSESNSIPNMDSGSNQSGVVQSPQRNTKLRRLEELVSFGLIETKTVSLGRPNIFYYLTPEGERICRLLKQIENGSAEERDPSKLENAEQLAEKAELH